MKKKKRRKGSMQKRDKSAHRGFDLQGEWAAELVAEADALGLQIVESRLINDDTIVLAKMALHHVRAACDTNGDKSGMTIFLLDEDGDPSGYIAANVIGESSFAD
jgi:hypothetical protein